MTDDVYTHGHHESVLRSHRWRTAENSAGYLLPHLDAGRSSPRRRLRTGHDHRRPRRSSRARATSSASTSPTRSSPTAGRAAEEAGAANVTFARGDAYGVDVAAGSFDVVHAHQVLQHLGDPIAALTEMGRVLRPGGLLAVRDSDFGAFVWAPPDERLDHWMQLYHRVTERNGAQADAGRWLPSWVRAAGFTDLQVSSSTWTFADPRQPRLVGAAVGGSGTPLVVRQPGEGVRAQPTRLELDDIADAFESWASAPDGVFVVVHVEVLARTPP